MASSPFHHVPHYYIICIPIQTLSTMLAVFIGIKLWYQMWHLSKETKMPKTYRNAAIVCSISCICCLISDLSHVYYCFITNTFLFGALVDQIYSNADFFYYVATNAFYIVAFIRLHITFKGTIYLISDQTKYIIIFFLFISFVTATYYVIVVTMMKSVAFFYKYATNAIIILMINDCILNSTLMILFIIRLNKSISSRESSAFKEWNIDNKINSLSYSKFSRLSKNIIEVITMHTNLFGIAIFTNQLFLASLLSGFFWIPIQFYIFLFRGIECCANIIVLYLSLKTNKKQYHRFCRYCHYCIKRCCVHQTKKTVKKNVYHSLITNSEKFNQVSPVIEPPHDV